MEIAWPWFFPLFDSLKCRKYKRSKRVLLKAFLVSALKGNALNVDLFQLLESQRHGRMRMIEQDLGIAC